MAIDMRTIEPLGSKSALLEQAMRRNKGSSRSNNEHLFSDLDMSDMLPADFDWLKQDKDAIENLVRQMDASIGQLNEQLRDMGRQTRAIDQFTRKSKTQFEDEQKLLFKQIQTLNSLLKRQLDILNGVERQIQQVEIKQNNFLPHLGIGLIAGLMSAVTILISAPLVMIAVDYFRA
ncbi:hypothetical protein P8S54_05845 [Thiomicrospira sp. R3]|uniref:hypothetical protein n=1 Tax=Thiomicrospira sp. R3 TaxID=3035472 RepID=UPI00259B906B|nr:hypothetical protein [Thiomicrospira sp. R3]WFE67760.1 hypothetical protein P8S54_05845 [Thiomicrospira sp. R3]